MWPTRLLLATLAASLLLVPSVRAVESAPVEMWECPGPEGTILYTNKERPDCQAKVLKALSVVPSLPDLPLTPPSGSTYLPPPKAKDFSYDTPIGALRNLSQIPESGRDWYAGNTSGGSVQGEVCSMYMEWIHLNQNSRGGHFFGTDPSYGSNPTARNWYTPSYSFYDNARYVTLSQIFGAGFVPIGCH
ncbi:exported protein of unknown function [Nitrospira defluvii]|jgi:hypothetical protein|uniref:Exported protein n=1 Tax=Nitrospira defluvii TaxID=330214 RepID=B3U4K8_9BACT|nr:exported protein [Nitrospira defluvii]CBK41168.1 exported protein of unknown function [Nitrospira defluvii]